MNLSAPGRRFGLFMAAAVIGGTAGSARAETIYGMTAADSTTSNSGLGLVRFDSATPTAITSIGAFSGVVADHFVCEIDFRPATGQLYALSVAGLGPTFGRGQIYTVNLTTAALTPVGAGFSFFGAGFSTRYSMDFNPVADHIRISRQTIGVEGNNYRVNPNTGNIQAADPGTEYDISDPNFGAVSGLSGIAFSNNFAGATSTTLYGWDDDNGDTLVTVGGIGGTPSPNTGAMFTVFEPPGNRMTGFGMGMDISGATGTAYVTHDDPATGTVMGLYTLNLATGAETLVGTYGAGIFITDISVQPIPEPATIAALGLGLLGLALRLRRGSRSAA